MMGRATFTLVLCLAAASASGQGKDWPSERPPRALAEHPVTFPAYAMKTLANGLQVVAVSHHEQPAVSLRLIVRAGAAQDPEGKPGVAELAAALLDQGTATRSAEQIADAIDSIGGALGTGAGSDLSYINAVVMKDSFSAAMELVSDLAQHPAFAPEEIERQRQQALSGMRVNYDDPEFLANAPNGRLAAGAAPPPRPPPPSRRRRLRGGCSSSTSRAPCRPRSASATWRSHARATTTRRSTSPPRFWAEKGQTVSIACCAPSAASPTARRPTSTR
jgi:hypothetical protein